MTLDPHQFARARLRAASIVRWASLVLFTAGLVAGAVVWVLRTRNYVGFPPRSFAVHALVMAAGFWVPALVLGLGTFRLARWLVPPPPRDVPCPACGYPMGRPGPCPECGRTLAGPGDAAPPDPRGP
jgi:hypothetical protein